MIRNQKGFSLIELMIVVAIIGILAAVAIPNYIRFQEKAKQSAAKDLLAGLYTAEKAYFAEYSTFCARFDAVGFKPEGAVGYDTGFAADGGCSTAATAPQGTATCIDTGVANPPPACIATYAGSWTVDTTTAKAPTKAGTPTAAVFIAASAAKICQNCGANDEWSIDQNKNVQWQVQGLD